jgi:hypothetical protein
MKLSAYSAKTGAASRLPALRKCSAAAIALLIVALVALSFGQAVAKKMHHNLTWGAYADFESMSVAISDLVYHLDDGYLAYGAIIDLFNARLGSDTPAGEVPHVEHMGDADYINEAIRDAVSINQISIISPSYPLDFRPIIYHDLVPVYAEDVGRVDYYKAAFSLFGFKVQSMHYLFFLLLLVSSLLFLAGFHRQLVPTVVLTTNLIVVNLIIDSNLFFESLPSISAYRAVSALAIIPICHLILCVLYRVRLLSLAGSAGLAQAGLFIFVVWSRSSAQWGILAVLMVTALVGLRQRAWRDPRCLAVWPVVAVLAGMLGLAIYSRNALHPAYFTDELLPSHFVWHSAYLGLAYNPDWPFPEDSDAIAFVPSTKYLTAARPDIPVTQAPLTNGYWFRLHDQIVRQLFLEFAREHPRYMLKLYAWWKPVRFIRHYGHAMQPFVRGLPLVGLAMLMVLAGFAATWLRDAWWEAMLPVLTVTGIVALTSYAPLLWAYPSPHVMVDAVWTTTSFLLVLAVIAGGAAVRMFHVLRPLADARRKPAETIALTRSTVS